MNLGNNESARNDAESRRRQAGEASEGKSYLARRRRRASRSTGGRCGAGRRGRGRGLHGRRGAGTIGPFLEERYGKYGIALLLDEGGMGLELLGNDTLC